MKQTVYESDFIDAFKALRPDNFSYQGLRVLFEMLTELEQSCDEEIELDVIAICCEFSELSWDDIVEQYGLDCEMTHDAIEEYLIDNGGFAQDTANGTVVFQDF